ncbi:MAG TPA: cob(I)yrinic acid a,c-diamide adenosyltransferase [Candidatus Kapabacteria bacterium]|jgi:cob(I)alamin adenosyltransferase|nr:cob(I)yrinic acid a,c-diamide adenosyltransferase [Candidatus Kapabacteria bacterium]HOM05832.1 cob(I)yrinic acid a,c-diamide adenosyltransferase [Candidatus Kapabacteria bacterium]HOQ50004.1 cob(I)yrinic acid a,c-diamide adenosyltransferase [Candidatus Kapabacteria bacterium]HPP39514.1 cob(I)yrinic acid a,c-diamide adenosyltransferase [Candidatus Kapabacteria bacterium]HPU24188.1 cob(I)yrinic acid a,c-diamide adenosyltransferase [Candidatus Kapabacteria bacterium]
MKIYTKTGDNGTTSLFDGKRVRKDNLRVETYGTVDELNSIIGLALAFDIPAEMKNDLIKINNDLFILGSDLATPINNQVKVNRIDEHHIKWLEQKIDEYSEILPPLRNFILPGGTHSAAFLHQARTVCRRLERIAVTLSEAEDLGQFVIIYINRLSDYLFVAARFANFLNNREDVVWNP